MSTRRQPSIAPRIPGYEYVRLLGMGGFADVFEYRQELPRRSVAVKVLLGGSLDQDAREAFFAEANVMAQLSHHPSIVTIYHADIAADGRPFLVMEYCSRPSLGARYRTERFTVAEVLRTGIRVASAVEAAHRLGILHRDIKPANILATDFGWPALTDFGIAATLGSSAAATGMSIPWSAPELLAEHPTGDVRGDVYSLGATLYTLLAGRSPFEIPGRNNTPADLLSRIERSPLTPIDRQDVPPGLSAVLARSMTKDPERRFISALALAHALQQVERSMQLPVTSIDLSEEFLPAPADTVRDPSGGRSPFEAPGAGGADSGDPGSDQATRLRPITSIDPTGGRGDVGGAAPSQTRAPASGEYVGTVSHPHPGPDVAGEIDDQATRMRPVTSISPDGDAPAPRPARHSSGRAGGGRDSLAPDAGERGELSSGPAAPGGPSDPAHEPAVRTRSWIDGDPSGRGPHATVGQAGPTAPAATAPAPPGPTSYGVVPQADGSYGPSGIYGAGTPGAGNHGAGTYSAAPSAAVPTPAAPHPAALAPGVPAATSLPATAPSTAAPPAARQSPSVPLTVGPPVAAPSAPGAAPARPAQFRADEGEVRARHYRTSPHPADEQPAGDGATGRRVLVGASSVVVVALLAFVAVQTFDLGPQGNPQEKTTPTPTPTLIGGATVPAPADLEGRSGADGTATFRWTNPDEQEGDAYLWRVVGVGAETPAERIDRPSVSVDVADGATSVCIEVSIVRADGRATATPAQGCSS